MRRTVSLLAFVLACFVASSACAPPPPLTAPRPAGSAADALAQLEHRLLTGTGEIHFVVVATGAHRMHVEGTLSFAAGNGIVLSAKGSLDGTDIDVFVGNDGDEVRFGKPVPHQAPLPPHLRESIVLGMTRMGLAHNLVLLAGGAEPDHATQGGLSARLTVKDTMWDGDKLAFILVVDGQPRGKAKLTFLASGDLVTRHTKVDFGGGKTMTVDERYDWTSPIR